MVPITRNRQLTKQHEVNLYVLNVNNLVYGKVDTGKCFAPIPTCTLASTGVLRFSRIWLWGVTASAARPCLFKINFVTDWPLVSP